MSPSSPACPSVSAGSVPSSSSTSSSSHGARIYSNIEGKKKRKEKQTLHSEKVRYWTAPTVYTGDVYQLLSKEEILKCVTWTDIYGEVTLPDSSESRNACPWRVSLLAVKAARAFLSNRNCEKSNKKGTGRTSNQNKGYCSSRNILYHNRTVTTTWWHMCIRSKLKPHTINQDCSPWNWNWLWGYKSKTESRYGIDHYYTWKLFNSVQIQQSLVTRSKKVHMLYKWLVHKMRYFEVIKITYKKHFTDH